MDGLAKSWEEFSAKHHDQQKPQVLPDFAMKLRHLHFSVILLLHRNDAGRFMHFRATGYMPKRQFALMREKPGGFARPLSQHLRLEPPPANPGERIKRLAKVPFSEIDLTKPRRIIRLMFSASRPTIKVFSERSVLALAVQWIECEVDPDAWTTRPSAS